MIYHDFPFPPSILKTNKLGRSLHRNNVSWITTKSTLLDFGHPVARNREFGIYEDPSNKGEYIFYISAVDRAWDPTFNLVFKFGGAFKKGDELWENVQLNITKFINRGFGIAEFNPSKNITKRPDWEDVQDYLSGKITYQELKTKLGC